MTDEPAKRRGPGGVERKILWPLLWLGLVPLMVFLAVGYVALREWKARVAEEALISTATQGAHALSHVLERHLAAAQRLAARPEAVGALSSDASRNRLEDLAALAFEGHGYEGFGFDRGETVPEPSRRLDRRAEGWRLTLLAPVHGPGGTGALAAHFNLRALAEPLVRATNLPAHSSRTGLLVGTGDDATLLLRDGDVWTAVSGAVAATLAARLDSPEPAVFHDEVALAPATAAEGLFLAHAPVLPGVRVLSHADADDVFREVNLGAFAALLLCLAVIALAGVAAYRSVRNKIARNIRIVNEGAQLIGQGDLDLRLDLKTGDELEELARSFNGMAQALKRNIDQLEAGERKYRSLVTSMRDGIVQMGRNGLVGYINPAGAAIFGYERHEDLLGKSLRSLFTEWTEARPLVREFIRDGFIERSRVWVTRTDGRRICLEVTASIVRDDAGRRMGVEGLFRDVTSSVELERDATERAERISAINQIANAINSSLQAGSLYDSIVAEIKKLVNFDHASLALLNDKENTLDVRPLWPRQDEPTVFPAEDTRCGAAMVLQSQEVLRVDDRDAPEAPALAEMPEDTRSCVSVPLHSATRVVGALSLGAGRKHAFTGHDVEVLGQVSPHVAAAIRNGQLLASLQRSLDDVMRTQRELHAANEELKSLDEMKTNLLSNVSHELRTPLVAVMGYTDMIYNGKAGPVTESQKEYLGISLRNIDRLVTLIENLLDFSRMHRGAERIAFETFDLADCARKSMEVVRPVAESREIVLELEAPDEPVFVEGDNGKLSQVFTNLLSNAVKFNHTGGRVTVTLVLSEDTVEARVADTGIGMPPESLDKVFSRFYQLDSSSTRKYGGTGIGLSIAQDICRLHGTRLTVRSEVGKGSEFRFSLPLKRERGDDETASVASVDETELLVELVTRDRALCTQVRMLLDGENANVVIAGTIDNAVHLAERHQPDCLLVDREAGCVRDDVVDALAGHGPVDGGLVVYTSDDAAYARYSDRAAARLKPGFRKSALLSAISHAMGAHGAVASELGNGVLCVDDDPEIVGFITNLLEPEGFRVVGCASGAEALERVGSKDYGLVLLDIAMPGMDGWEACRRMKTDPALAGIRVYMVTAKPVSKYDSRAQEARPDGYLLKPFRPGDLLELVRTGASAPRSDDSQEGAES